MNYTLGNINIHNQYNHYNTCFRAKKCSPLIQNAKNIQSSLSITSEKILLYGNHLREQYLQELALGLSKETGKKISSKQLEAVMTRQEVLAELPKLNEQNYIASDENIKNGVFQADLHSHTNNSDGRISVKEILEQAANYGNRVSKINGKKFIFSITDHDGINGVKEALKYIADEPEKYKNIRFIPGVELSFIMPSEENSIRYKISGRPSDFPEVLAYGINPFSENTQCFLQKTYTRRKNQVMDVIKTIKKLHPKWEFSEKEAHPYENYFMYTQNYGLYNYIRTKSILNSIAEQLNIPLKEIENEYIEYIRMHRIRYCPESIISFLERKRISATIPPHDSEIFDMIFPTYKNVNKANSPYEKNFKEVTEYALKEHAILSFAHPAYTISNFAENNQLNSMQELIKQSEGTLKMAEKFHQAYRFGIQVSKEGLNRYNDIIDQLNLINIGGRDNHSDKFIEKF